MLSRAGPCNTSLPQLLALAFLANIAIFLYKPAVPKQGLFSHFFRFHVVASKGNLDCLNTILVHGVDITATDAAGGFPHRPSLEMLSAGFHSGIKLNHRIALPSCCSWQKTPNYLCDLLLVLRKLAGSCHGIHECSRT